MTRAVLLIALLVPSVATADATITINVTDSAAEGFNDPTPATPIGGNDGTTLGAQRLNSIEHAASLWAALLESDVEIKVNASFDTLGCGAGGAITLGQASPRSAFFGTPLDGSMGTWAFASALADQLAGTDQEPGEADIIAAFNKSADDTGCVGQTWYYGLDSDHGGAPDLVNVAMHELAHGLGFLTYTSKATGNFLFGAVDPYSANTLDLSSGEHWDEMSSAERRVSYDNVRSVVFDGASVKAHAGTLLQAGAPSLTTDPPVAGFAGHVTESTFGPRVVDSPITAELVVGNPINGCDEQTGVAGKVVLLRPECFTSGVTQLAEEAGALGVLLVSPDGSNPPLGFNEYQSVVVGIPALAISDADADALQQAMFAGTVTVTMDGDPAISAGATAAGQVYLYASDTAGSSSAISHWDPLVRPNLLMEPNSTPRSVHDADLTINLLEDLGWSLSCGNGVSDPGEQCDDGASNSDTDPGATCRTNCRTRGCGDGVVETGEDCDDGVFNHDDIVDQCRTDCSAASCGDGTRDSAEECDNGAQNNDTEPGRCRTNCRTPYCGDGVERAFVEQCDEGEDNSDTEPSACRLDCTNHFCGDGVTDVDEDCDDGGNNGFTMCSSTCTLPATDSGTEMVTPVDPTPIIDAGVLVPPDAGMDSLPDGAVMMAEDDPMKKKKAGGCGCRLVAGHRPLPPSAPWFFVALCAARIARRRAVA